MTNEELDTLERELHKLNEKQAPSNHETLNSKKEVQFLYTTTIESEEDGELVYFDSEKRTILAKTPEEANRKLYEEFWDGSFSETCGSVVSFINPIDKKEYPIEKFDGIKSEIDSFFDNSSLLGEIKKEINELSKKIQTKKEKHGSFSSQTTMYQAGWDLGYSEGRLSALKGIMDELKNKEDAIIDVDLSKNIVNPSKKIKL